jgi:hypothetical protein
MAWIKYIYYNIKDYFELRKRRKELRKKDPYIYK